MEFLANYGLFLAKMITWVIAILVILITIVALVSKNTMSGLQRFKINKLNKKYDELRETMEEEILSKTELKKVAKQRKTKEKTAEDKQRTVFVIHFVGGTHAQEVSSLREEITAVLTIAKPGDEVVVCVESPGGVVHGYGLAASQLDRIKQRKIALTVCVDKVAASGGYLMASVADKILAAPFAILGSIGVVAQMPNLHRLLKQNHVDFELITAGEYKRTLTMFGENTAKGREKFQEQVDDTHQLFKDFVSQHRSVLNIDEVASGEYWFGTRALQLKLVDEICTSDDYLLQLSGQAKIIQVEYKPKKSLGQKLALAGEYAISRTRRELNSTTKEEFYL